MNCAIWISSLNLLQKRPIEHLEICLINWLGEESLSWYFQFLVMSKTWFGAKVYFTITWSLFSQNKNLPASYAYSVGPVWALNFKRHCKWFPFTPLQCKATYQGRDRMWGNLHIAACFQPKQIPKIWCAQKGEIDSLRMKVIFLHYYLLISSRKISREQ